MNARVAVFAALVVALAAVAQDQPAPTPAATPRPTPKPLSPVTSPTAKERRVKIYAEDWKFSPREIHIPVGTKLHLDFETHDSSHSFDIKELKIKVPLPQDKPVSYEFVADKKGEYKYYCGRPCGDGCPKMVGKLFVE
jgi:heme/copper-type cytochrome/quinol oxidase subunit 2